MERWHPRLKTEPPDSWIEQPKFNKEARVVFTRASFISEIKGSGLISLIDDFVRVMPCAELGRGLRRAVAAISFVGTIPCRNQFGEGGRGAGDERFSGSGRRAIGIGANTNIVAPIEVENGTPGKLRFVARMETIFARVPAQIDQNTIQRRTVGINDFHEGVMVAFTATILVHMEQAARHQRKTTRQRC